MRKRSLLNYGFFLFALAIPLYFSSFYCAPLDDEGIYAGMARYFRSFGKRGILDEPRFPGLPLMLSIFPDPYLGGKLLSALSYALITFLLSFESSLAALIFLAWSPGHFLSFRVLPHIPAALFLLLAYLYRREPLKFSIFFFLAFIVRHSTILLLPLFAYNLQALPIFFGLSFVFFLLYSFVVPFPLIYSTIRESIKAFKFSTSPLTVLKSFKSSPFLYLAFFPEKSPEFFAITSYVVYFMYNALSTGFFESRYLTEVIPIMAIYVSRLLRNLNIERKAVPLALLLLLLSVRKSYMLAMHTGPQPLCQLNDFVSGLNGTLATNVLFAISEFNGKVEPIFDFKISGDVVPDYVVLTNCYFCHQNCSYSELISAMKFQKKIFETHFYSTFFNKNCTYTVYKIENKSAIKLYPR